MVEKYEYKFVHDIPVYILKDLKKTLPSIGPVCRVKFVNCFQLRSEYFVEFRPNIINKSIKRNLCVGVDILYLEIRRGKIIFII